MREAEELRVFHTGEHVCGYFPDRIARDLVIDPRDPRLAQISNPNPGSLLPDPRSLIPDPRSLIRNRSEPGASKRAR